MISPLKFDHPTDEIAVTFSPFYLYESVTANVLDEVEHLTGWQDRVRDSEEESQQKAPVS
jgi:hypothetical protein